MNSVETREGQSSAVGSLLIEPLKSQDWRKSKKWPSTKICIAADGVLIITFEPSKLTNGLRALKLIRPGIRFTIGWCSVGPAMSPGLGPVPDLLEQVV